MVGYNTGWNDIAHGILTWTPHDKWQSALAWAIHCREIAQECIETCHLHNKAIYQGSIDAVNHYQQTGCIERKLSETWS